MEKNNILIIGGGASGMMAAIFALEYGAKVTIAEKNNRLGKKVLVTGNGRCNITNTDVSYENYHGANPRFVNNIFSQFDNNQTIDFFNKLGVVTKVEERGRVFPFSDQASSIVDILTHHIQDLGGKIMYETCVTGISKKDDFFEIVFDSGVKQNFDKVIISAGGKAAPAFGSDGSGHDLALSLNHKVTATWPSLVQLILKGDFFKEIMGVKIDGSASLVLDGKIIKKELGEILFTHYGVSGPAILKISREVKRQILEGKKVSLKIALVNNFDLDTLDEFLKSRFVQLGDKSLKTSFLGFIQKKLIPYLLTASGVENINKKCAEVSTKERKAIVETILGWEFEVLDTHSYKHAQVTAGGVSTDEVSPKTLESKKVPGLYFSGEVLDIDGDSGGYNLQFAWSTGYIAGKYAATTSVSI